MIEKRESAQGRLPALLPVRPEALVDAFAEEGGKIVLLYGDSLTFRFSLMMAARAMKSGGMVAVVDACNRFDVHLLAMYARKHRIDPDAFLRRIFVSRGFTCYQVEAAVAGRLSRTLRRIGSSTAMIFGLLDTMYDEQAKLHEVQQILERLLVALRKMKEENISLLLTCSDWKVLPRERNQLFARLKAGSDRVYRFAVNEHNAPVLYLEDEIRSDASKGLSKGPIRKIPTERDSPKDSPKESFGPLESPSETPGPGITSKL